MAILQGLSIFSHFCDDEVTTIHSFSDPLKSSLRKACRVYEKIHSWERKEIRAKRITKNPRNEGGRGKGETLFYSRNLIRGRREKSGRARVNGSMGKRSVLEVVLRAMRNRRSPSRILVNVVALYNNRSASRSRVTTRIREPRLHFPFNSLFLSRIP